MTKIWIVANISLNTQLMEACVSLMRKKLESIGTDRSLWKMTNIHGMCILLQNDYTSNWEKAFNTWLNVSNQNDCSGVCLCKLIDNINLDLLSIDTLIIILEKSAELNIPKQYR